VTGNEWVEEFPGTITIVDRDGFIVYMNECAAAKYGASGGQIGGSVFDCHPLAAARKLREMMDARQPYVYTTERGGKGKIVCQSPWYQDGEYAGFVEFTMEAALPLPHFVRDRKAVPSE